MRSILDLRHNSGTELKVPRAKEPFMEQQQEQHLSWSESPDHPVPEHIIGRAQCGTLSDEFTSLHVSLSVRRLPSGHATHFHAHLGDTLLRVYEKAAEALQERLLPPAPAIPFDLLFFHTHDGEWRATTANLEEPLWEALAGGMTRHLGIDYRLIVRINAKWGVVTSERLTPKQLLAELEFDPAQFSLYRHDSDVPLPPDAPLHVRRGEHFEAQKDGRYGGTASPPVIARGLQRIEYDVEQMRQAGESLRLLSEGGQRYVEIAISIPAPPWSASSALILIAVPANYPIGGLDAFYLDPDITIRGTVHRAQAAGPLLGKKWNLISWHYSVARPWNPRIDDFQSHVAHCKGFFLERGVVSQ
jgi:Prokaryotic E2 family E